MNRPIDAAPSSPSRGRTLLRLVLGAIALVLLVYGALALWTQHRLDSARENARGGSVDFATYVPEPWPEDAPNGTDYTEAAALVVEGQGLVYLPREGEPDAGLVEVQDRIRVLSLERTDPTEEDLEVFRREVERLSLALDILDRGFALTDRARYFTDWDVVPFDLVIPNLLTPLRFSTLIRARGEIALAEGRLEDAWADAARIQRLGTWLSRSLPTLINALVARAVHQQGMFLTERLLAKGPVDRELREAVLTEAAAVPLRDHYDFLLDAERSATFSTLIDPRADAELLRSFGAIEEGPAWGTIQGKLLDLGPWRRYNAARYLEWADDFFARCKLPSHQQPRDVVAAFEESRPSPVWGIAHRAAYDCGTVTQKRDLAIAHFDLLRFALALQDHFEEHGEYPRELPELEGAEPIDPFSGEPYRYLRTDDGYRLWSVSLDRRDDGGALPPAKGSRPSIDWEQGDLVWWVQGKESAGEGL